MNISFVRSPGIKADQALKVIIVIALASTLYLSFNRSFSRAEVESIHTAWKIVQGEKIYTDFFQNRHPLFFQLIAPVIILFRESVMALIVARLLSFMALIATLVLTYRLARLLFDRQVSLVSIALLSTTYVFLHPMLEIRPEGASALAFMAGTFLFLKYVNTKSWICLVLSSSALAISFLIMQESMVFVIAIASIIASGVMRGRIPARDLWVFLAVFMGLVAVYIAISFRQARFVDYIVCAWAAKSRAFIGMIADRQGNPWGLGRYLAASGPTAIFWVLGTSFFDTPIRRKLGWISMSAFILALLPYRSEVQYIVFSAPLMAIGAAYGIFQVLQGWRRSLALFFMMVIPAHLILQDTWIMPNRPQLQMFEYVISAVPSDGYVYDGGCFFNLFRKDVDYFWNHGGVADTPVADYRYFRTYDYDIYGIIDRLKPMIISGYKIDWMDDSRLYDHYERARGFSGLFIRTD